MLNLISSFYSITILFNVFLTAPMLVDSCCCTIYAFWRNCGCNEFGCLCEDYGECLWKRIFTHGPCIPDDPPEYCWQRRRRVGRSVNRVSSSWYDYDLENSNILYYIYTFNTCSFIC